MRAVADARGADGAEPRARPPRRRLARGAGRGADRRAGRGDPLRGGSRPLQGGAREGRARVPAVVPRAERRRRARLRGPARVPARLATELHARRNGRGHRVRRARARREGARGARGVAVGRGARRGERHRLEGVRARGHPRRGRQLRGRVLHRERRSHGRPHGRLDHRRARDDAHRPRVPAAARRRARGDVGGGRGDGRVERAVRGRPQDGARARHRDEPARIAVVGARVEGDGLPHREDRGDARGGVPPRRAGQRHRARGRVAHHRRVRARDRLRRREVAALHVREVPRGRPSARHADEERRRGDGDRADVPRGAPEGGAVAGDGARRAGDAVRERGLRGAGGAAGSGGGGGGGRVGNGGRLRGRE